MLPKTPTLSSPASRSAPAARGKQRAAEGGTANLSHIDCASNLYSVRAPPGLRRAPGAFRLVPEKFQHLCCWSQAAPPAREAFQKRPRSPRSLIGTRRAVTCGEQSPRTHRSLSVWHRPRVSPPAPPRSPPEVPAVVGDPLGRAVGCRGLQHHDLHLLADVALRGGDGAFPLAVGGDVDVGEDELAAGTGEGLARRGYPTVIPQAWGHGHTRHEAPKVPTLCTGYPQTCESRVVVPIPVSVPISIPIHPSRCPSPTW